jgi:adenosine kinase
MPLMVHDLLITRSERGATLVHQTNKKLTQHNIPGIINTQTVDPTGCGDVFGAAYLYHYIKSNDSLQAVTVANRIAAFKATVRGPEALDSLKEHFTLEISA